MVQDQRPRERSADREMLEASRASFATLRQIPGSTPGAARLRRRGPGFHRRTFVRRSDRIASPQPALVRAKAASLAAADPTILEG